MQMNPAARNFCSALQRFAGLLIVSIALASCGPSPTQSRTQGADTIVAATVNGKPIYVADVHSEAAERGLIREGEELDVNGDEFFQILEEIIETRLFSLEAEARQLDRNADVRHRLERARELVLASALNDQIRRSIDEAAVEKLYREQSRLLGKGREVRARRMVLPTRDAADAAKRRLGNGELFEALAYELSLDRATATDGGDLGFILPETLPQGLQEAAQSLAEGEVSPPIQVRGGWALLKIEERRAEAPPSMEALRPELVKWLMFDEQRRLVDRLKSQAKIERFIEEGRGAVAAKDDEAAPKRRQTDPSMPLGAGAVAGGAQARPPVIESQPPARQTPPAPPAAAPAAGDDSET